MHHHFYQNIQGWFDWEALYKEMIFILPDKGTFVEVGSWLGKSASFALVEAARLKRDLSLHCIDSWKAMRGIEDPCVVFKKNTGKLNKHLYCHKTDSVEGSRMFADKSVDFIYLDGDHAYESVRDDINCWLPKLKKTGIIAGHDYGGWPGVELAVWEAFHDNIFIFCGMSWLYLGEHHPYHDYINAVWDFQEGYLEKAWDFFLRLSLQGIEDKRILASVYFHLAVINDFLQIDDNLYWEKGVIILEENPETAPFYKDIVNNFNINSYEIALKAVETLSWQRADFWIETALKEYSDRDKIIRLLFKKGEILEVKEKQHSRLCFEKICRALKNNCQSDNDKYILASALKKLGDFAQAESLFNEILFSKNKNSYEAGIYFHFAEMALKQKRVELAKNYAEKVLKIIPEHKKANRIFNG